MTATAKKPTAFQRVLGVIGEILITAGVVIVLFIVWQVWYTDIAANRQQAEAIEVLQESFGGVVTADDGIAPRQEGEPPAWEGATEEGGTLGIMRIPRFGPDYGYTIQNGTHMERILDTGAFGRYEDTAYPGQIGNFAMAAHRQTYGAPMRDVADLEEGDAIVIETAETYLVYRFIAEEIVDPSAVWTIAEDPFAALANIETGAEIPLATRRLLTITTCHPPFISNERWIVHAELDYWTLRADGLPEALVQEG